MKLSHAIKGKGIEFAPKPEMEAFLDRVFAIATKELGIDGLDDGVRLAWRDNKADELRGLLVALFGESEDGVTYKTMGMVRNKLLPDGDYDMQLVIDSFPRLLKVFCHELIHVQQRVRGLLVITETTVSWRGDVYTQERYQKAIDGNLKGVPWEEDAHGRDDALAVRVFNQLSNADQIFIFKNS